jgi:hypothetical protein
VRGADAPISPPVLEQPLRERDVAVPAALTLADVDGHAVGIEISDLEGDDLTNAEAAGVGGSQQEAMPRMRAGAQQAPDFFPAQDIGQLLGLSGSGDLERGLLPPERHMVKEPERVGGLGARAPRALAFPKHQRDVRLHFVSGELVGGAMVVAGQADHLADVRLVGSGGETSHRHVADHPLAQLAHTPPPSGELGRRRLSAALGNDVGTGEETGAALTRARVG